MVDEIGALVFDAYGTLFDVHSVVPLADEIFPGIGGALSVLWRDKQLEYTRLRALCGQYADFWAVTGDALDFSCERLGLAILPMQRERLMRQYERVAAFPDSLAALYALKRMGLSLTILSNGTPKMLTSAVAAAGMDGIFDHILSVDQVKTFKTASQAYQLGLEAISLRRSQILFVSSNGWDICGATWFGYTTFWINRDGLPRERLGVEPSQEGRSLRDVLSYCNRDATSI
jgi:2-haloacid dehalogenase